MKNRFVLVLLTSIIPTFTPVVIQADSSTSGSKVEVPANAKEAWQRFDYLKSNITLEGIEFLKFVDGSSSKFNLKMTIRWPYACMEQRYVDPKTNQENGKRRVTCRGPRYSFVLEKQDDDTPYIVRSVVSKDKKESMSYFIHLENFIAAVCESPYRVGWSVPELTINNNFVVKSIKPAEVDGRTFQVLDFDLGDRDKSPKSGTIRFDPALNWAVVQYEIDMRAGNPKKVVEIVRGQRDFEQREGRIVPRKVVHTTSTYSTDRNSPPEDVIDWTLDEVSFDKIDDDAFSLAAFGLPDLGSDMTIRPEDTFFSLGNWPFWLSLSVAVAALVALVALKVKAAKTEP